MEILFLNFLLYLLYSLYFIRKSHIFTFHNIISLWFAFVAFMGWFTVITGIYQNVHSDLGQLSMIPYVVAFSAFIVLMWPLRVLNGDGSTLTFCGFPDFENDKFRKFTKVCLFFVSILLLIRFIAMINVLQMDSDEAYRLAQTEGVAYKYSDFELFLAGRLSILNDLVSPLFLFLGILMLCFHNGRIRRMYYYAITLPLLIVLAYNISQGARGGIFIAAINFMVIFLPFWKKFSMKAKMILKKGVFILGILAFIYGAAATIKRFGNQSASTETPITSFCRYMGEPFPHLGNKYWDQVEIHPMGGRFYPFIFGLKFNEAKNITSNSENQAIWEYITGVPILNYKTIYGDFYIEFGPYLGFLAIIIYALILRIFIKRQTISFAMVPLLYYYIDMYTAGPLLFGKWGLYNVRQLILLILFYFFIKFLFKNNNTKTLYYYE